jgi:hypothetical protein
MCIVYNANLTYAKSTVRVYSIATLTNNIKQAGKHSLQAIPRAYSVRSGLEREAVFCLKESSLPVSKSKDSCRSDQLKLSFSSLSQRGRGKPIDAGRNKSIS